MSWDGPSVNTNGSGGSDVGPTVSSIGPYGVAASEKYTVQTVQGGSSGKITYDIAVHATVTSTMVSGSNRVDVSRNLHATCTPIVLSLHGTTPDSGNLDNILIGQYCQASFVPQVPPGQATPPITLQNYHWTINGNTFKSYDVTTNAQGQANGKAEVKYLTAADIASSSPSWSWITEGDGTVTVTADVYLRDASTGLPTTLVQASITDNRPVTVVLPDYDSTTVSGDVEVIPLGVWYLAAVNHAGASPGTVGPGIRWKGNVNPQPLFNATGQGSWNYVQIVQPSRSCIKPPNQYVSSLNTHIGLDTSYSYGYPPGDQSDVFNSLDGSGWQDNNARYYGNDSPRVQLTNDMTIASASDQFWTYMMYKPKNGTWVPLHRIAWQWSGTAVQPGTGWAPATVGAVTVTEDKRCTTHPKWDEIVTSDAATWLLNN